MEKPISIVIEELKNTIYSSLSESKIPVAVLDLIVKDVYDNIHNIAESQYKKDLEQYNNRNQEEVTSLL